MPPHFPPAFPAWLAGFIGAWVILGGGLYFCLARLALTGGGKVSAREFGLPDMVLCGLFLLWFGTLIANGFHGPERVVTQQDIVRGAAVYVAIVVLIGGFMHYRGIDPIRQFGLRRQSPLLCVPLAAGMLTLAYPLVLLAAKLTELVLKGKTHPQNIVEFFLNASQDSNKAAVYLTMGMAVIIAPAAEEAIFRGYIYGVLKRYLGGIAAAVISAAMFGAMHMSVSALPALFVLALCFTLAYEATGSLLVNIFMHGLFNLANLLIMMKFAPHLTGT